MRTKPKKDERSYYDLAVKQIDINRKQRDQFIGTLMLLAYDGCISDGRARELIDMDIYQWRKECARIMRKEIKL
jgi:hypothetical protein